MVSESIQDFVLRRLSEGADLQNDIWLEVREQYPLHKAGWSYLCRLRRIWRHRKAIAETGAPMRKTL